MNRIFFLLFLIPIFHSRSIKPKVSLCENVVRSTKNRPNGCKRMVAWKWTFSSQFCYQMFFLFSGPSSSHQIDHPLYPGPYTLIHGSGTITIHNKVNSSHTKTSPSSVITIPYHSFEIILFILYQAYTENVILAFTRNAEYSHISWDSV